MTIRVDFRNENAHPVFLSVNEKDVRDNRQILLMPDDRFTMQAAGEVTFSEVTLFHPPQPGKGVMEP